jgi:hypothetical protein
MPFFTFNQNNSGGDFIQNKTLAHFVIVEANSPKLANKFAEKIGIYFDGCLRGMDCSCCGDRWDPILDKTEGEEVPMVYGIPVEDIKAGYDLKPGHLIKWGEPEKPDILVYRKGVVEPEGFLY